MLITNAHILPIGCDEIDNGFILIENGKIICVGDMKHLSNNTAEKYCNSTIDAEGCITTPGLIDSHCHLGLFRDLIGDREINNRISYERFDFYASDAVDFFDNGFRQARESGVTTVVVSPGSACPVGGFSCGIKTFYDDISEFYNSGNCYMSINGNNVFKYNKKLSLKISLGDNIYNQSKMNKMETLSYLRSFFCGDLHNKENKVLFHEFKNPFPVTIHVHSAGDILTAIELAEVYGLDLTLVHATQAGVVIDYLAKKNVKIILGPAVCSITKPELAGFDLSIGELLYSNGIKFSISTDSPEVPTYLLTTCAGLYVKFGLNEMEALRCITSYAAEICGLYDYIGSLVAGKDADIVIWSEFPLNTKAVPKYVIIGGSLI